jgi:hypothetical protein
MQPLHRTHDRSEGIAAAPAAPNFTLQPGASGEGGLSPAVVIATDANTTYNFNDNDDHLDTGCPANNFTCPMEGPDGSVTVNVQWVAAGH